MSKAAAQGGTDLFHENLSRTHPNPLSLIQDGGDANFAKRIPHCMQVDQRPIAQGNGHLEVNLPAFMHLCRLLGTNPHRLFLAFAMKTWPLMEVAANASWRRMSFARQARLFFQMAAKTPNAPTRTFQPQAQNPVAHQPIELL